MLELGIFDLRYEVDGHDLTPGDEVRGEGHSVTAFQAEHTVPALGYVFQEDQRPGRFDVERALALGVVEGPSFARLVEGGNVKGRGGIVTPAMVMGPPRKGIRVVYSGDTAPCQGLERACQGADVLVHEATVASELEDKAREFGHSTARDAAELAKRAGVASLYLVHISGRYEDPSPLLEEARGIFPSTIIPNDLDSFVVRRAL